MSYKTLRLYLQHGQGRQDTAELPMPEELKSRLPRRFYLAWRQKMAIFESSIWSLMDYIK